MLFLSFIPELLTNSDVAKILIPLFLAILFLQSGLDKIIDWKGNLTWLKGHLSNLHLKILSRSCWEQSQYSK